MTGYLRCHIHALDCGALHANSICAIVIELRGYCHLPAGTPIFDYLVVNTVNAKGALNGGGYVPFWPVHHLKVNAGTVSHLMKAFSVPAGYCCVLPLCTSSGRRIFLVVSHLRFIMHRH